MEEMITVPRAVVALIAAVLSGSASAQSAPGEPIQTTLCELVRDPEQFQGKMVAVRGPVQIGFEVFDLPAEHCDGRKIDDVWLEYGKGPKRQPTIWCCGDLVPRDSPALLENADFRKFHRYLTAQSKAKGCHPAECYLYKVTATLTGRFDAVQTEPCPGDREMHCCPATGGFGHLGMSCSRFVIRSVSDVVADGKN